MSEREPTLYLQSKEDEELRLRPVAKGEEAVRWMLNRLELKILGRTVVSRRGVQVGYLVRQPADIKQIREVHEELKRDCQRSISREDWPSEASLELVFLETPR